MALKYKQDEFAGEIKKISLIKLYELGKISAKLAADSLELNRLQFIELLGEYNVSIFSYEEKAELLQDIKNA